jgi:oligopeptide/dipeptide ABC transporter ATP-binding protein
MYAGRIVEIGRARDIYRMPAHPYTQLLLRSVPIPDPVLERARRASRPATPSRSMPLTGDGCAFAPRCPRAQFPICAATVPPLVAAEDGRAAACHFPDTAPVQPQTAREAAVL